MSFDYHADPVLGAILAYWQAKRGQRAMPARADIDPADIPRLLPNIQLVEIVEGGRRFRYRLVGTALVTAFGREYTGTYLDELFPGERGRFVRDVFQAVCERRQPVFSRSRYVTAKDIDLVANRLCLPLSEDGRNVHMLLGALTFELGVEPVAGAWGDAILDASAHHLEPVG